MASTVAAQETPRRDRTTELIKVRYVTNSSTGMHVTVWLEPRTPHQEGAPVGTRGALALVHLACHQA